MGISEAVRSRSILPVGATPGSFGCVPLEWSVILWSFSFIAGTVAAVIDSSVMLPLDFDSAAEKRRAIAGAFCERFFLGFLIGPVAAGLGVNGIIMGALLGLGLSLGTAVITRTWAPILGMGLLTGIAVGIAYELAF
jgi:hypothetical protein